MSHVTRAYRVANQMSRTSKAMLHHTVKPIMVGRYRFSAERPPEHYYWEYLTVYPDGSLRFSRDTIPPLEIFAQTEEELLAILAEKGLPPVDLENEAWCTNDGEWRIMEDSPVTFL